jgi:toxin-antitoxin system PIN domain toxin
MTYLADVNVWVALAVVDHIHHAAAVEWLRESEEDPVAFCRITQNGLLRLLTNPRVMGSDVLTAARAWEAYDTLCNNARIQFVHEPLGIEQSWREATKHQRTGPNLWTDAYLAAFATAAGFSVVTFDQGFARHRGAKVRLLKPARPT